MRFNGIDLRSTPGGFTIDQDAYLQEFSNPVPKSGMTFEEFYPDCLEYVAVLSQYTEKVFQENRDEGLRLLRKFRKVITAEPSKSGLSFMQIPPGDIEVVVCIDASFAINLDQS